MTFPWSASLLIAGLVVTQEVPYERSDGSWLDAPTEWRFSNAELLRGQPEGPNSTCDPTTRASRSAAERLLTEAGWKLRLDTEVNRTAERSIEIVQAFRQFDGMCRSLQAQAFVFVNNGLIGVLSPKLMNARKDGDLADVVVSGSGEIRAKFFRYGQADALCCPSRESLAVYSVMLEGDTNILRLLRVDTRPRTVP